MKKILTRAVIACSIAALSWCSLSKKTDTTTMPDNTNAAAESTTPTPWSNVSVNYVGSLEDGTIFDTNIVEEAKKAGSGVYSETRTYSPLKFTIGQGQMIPWFEEAVVGMQKGETKTVTIPADKAYGQPKEELIFTTGASMFTSAGIEPVIWQLYNFGGAPGKVVALGDGTVTLDFNHELAGKALTFKITLLDITPATQPSAEGTTTVQ